ncbi:MAG: hypothetical protein U5J62_04370 [Desulfurivibrio sp.]|nr:hypothetical protein [Desulfurivibrio sp.]
MVDAVESDPQSPGSGDDRSGQKDMELRISTKRARLRDLAPAVAHDRLGNITGHGHGLAMSAAAACFRRVPRIRYQLSGLAGIASLKALDERLDDAAELDALADRLSRLTHTIIAAPTELLAVTDPIVAKDVAAIVGALWKNFEAHSTSLVDPRVDKPPREQAWITSTQVNFCAEAHPTVPEDHPDNAALSVLAGILRNAYLHGQLRKRGAYGAVRRTIVPTEVFRFYSYRDPNLMRTFEIFEESVDWILRGDIDFDLVEESILGLIAGVDAPSSPAGEARQAFQNALFGRGPESRRQIRQRILAVGVDDIERVAGEYLNSGCARALITSDDGAAELPGTFVTHRI